MSRSRLFLLVDAMGDATSLLHDASVRLGYIVHTPDLILRASGGVESGSVVAQA
jgi:hypothetical protein